MNTLSVAHLITARNIAADHRYSAIGRGAIYASTSQSVVAAEMQYYGLALATRSIVSAEVSIGDILDLTDPLVRDQLGITLEQITGNDYALTQALGDFARTRYNGILVPSARLRGGVNLVLFGD